MLLKNIRIVDDRQDFTGDIAVKEGVIVQVGTRLPVETDTIDFTGKKLILLPAFTDLHAHFRDPGFTHKEDLLSGSRAALRGGYTAVNLMPNTNPVCSNMDLVRNIEQRLQAVGLIYGNQTLSMTKDLLGVDYHHLTLLQKNEIPFITDDGKGVNNDAVMESIFDICKEKNIVIMSHAEDNRYSKTDMRKAENSMTFRDLKLCERCHGRIHFCHVSTIEAIEAIAEARHRGVRVTCEVTPHHLFATSEEVNHYRVNPPFRDQHDVEALIMAIQTGVVDAIATDHAPHTSEDKANGAPGMVGLEIAFALCYTKLVKNGYISLQKLVQLMSTTPSAMMHLNKGRIEVGMQADFAIVDLDNPYIIDPKKFISKSHNTPFAGKEVYGQIVHTVFKGKIMV